MNIPSLNFNLGETIEMLRDTVQSFAANEIGPRAAEIDRVNEFPADLWKKLGDLGLHGMTVEEEYGGTNMGYLAHIIALEEVSRASASVGLSYGAHSNLCVNQIRRNGNEAQKRKYLPKLISGEHVGALAMSEPNAGSDVVSMKLRADKRGDRYVLNGSKMWITNGGDADTLVVYAKTDIEAGPRGVTAFIIEKGMKGFSCGTHLDKVGMRGSNTYPLFFDDVEVPACNLVGEEDQGAFVMFNSLNPERILTGAICTGMAQQALAKAVEYSKGRVVFGDKPIGTYQGIAHPMAEVKINLEAAKLMTYKAAWAYDQGLDPARVGSLANMAKFLAADLAIRAADVAIEVHGGNGFSDEYGLIQLWNGARILKTAPVSREMILNFVAEQDLGLPRSY